MMAGGSCLCTFYITIMLQIITQQLCVYVEFLLQAGFTVASKMTVFQVSTAICMRMYPSIFTTMFNGLCLIKFFYVKLYCIPKAMH